MKVEKCEQQCNKTGSTKTVKFKNTYETMKELQDFNRRNRHYPLADIRAIGRHYVIKNTSHPYVTDPSDIGEFEAYKYGIRRHYTEAFAMRKDIYDNLIKLCNKPSSDEANEAAQAVA